MRNLKWEENPSWEWKNVNSFTPPSKSKGTAEYNQRWNEGYVHLLAEGIVRAAQAHHGNSVESIVAMTLMACRLLMEEGKEDHASILWKHVSDLLQKPNILNMTAKQLSTYKSYEAEGKLPPEFEKIYPRKGEGIYGDIQKLLDEDPRLLGVVLAWTEIKSNQLLLSSQADVHGLGIDSIRHKDRVYCQMKSGPLEMLVPLGLRGPLDHFNTTWKKLQPAQQEKVAAFMGKYETPLNEGRQEGKNTLLSLNEKECESAFIGAMSKPRIVAKQEINLLLMKGNIPSLGWVQDHLIDIVALYELGKERDTLFQILKELYPEYIEAVHSLITSNPEHSLREAVIFGIPERISHDRAAWAQLRKDMDPEQSKRFDKLCFTRVIATRPDIAMAILLERIKDGAEFQEIHALFDAIVNNPQTDAAILRPFFEGMIAWEKIPFDEMESFLKTFVEIVLKGKTPDIKMLKKILANENALPYAHSILPVLQNSNLSPENLVEILKAPIFLEQLDGPEDFHILYTMLSKQPVLFYFKDKLFPSRKDVVVPEMDYIDAIMCVGYCANKNDYSMQCKRIEDKAIVVMRLLSEHHVGSTTELALLPMPSKKGRTQVDDELVRNWIIDQKDFIQVIKGGAAYADLTDQILPWMRELPPEEWDHVFPEGTKHSELARLLGPYLRQVLMENTSPSPEMLAVIGRVHSLVPSMYGDLIPHLKQIYASCQPKARAGLENFIIKVYTDRLPEDVEALRQLRQAIGSVGKQDAWTKADQELIKAVFQLKEKIPEDFKAFISKDFDGVLKLFRQTKGNENEIFLLFKLYVKSSEPLTKEQATYFCQMLSGFSDEGPFLTFVTTNLSNNLLRNASPEALGKFMSKVLYNYLDIQGKDATLDVIINNMARMDPKYLPRELLNEIYSKAKKNPVLFDMIMPLGGAILPVLQKSEDKIPVINALYKELSKDRGSTSSSPAEMDQMISLLLNHASILSENYVIPKIEELVKFKAYDLSQDQWIQIFDYCFKAKSISKTTWETLFSSLDDVMIGSPYERVQRHIADLSSKYVLKNYRNDFDGTIFIMSQCLTLCGGYWDADILKGILRGLNDKGSLLSKMLSRPTDGYALTILWLIRRNIAIASPNGINASDEKLLERLETEKNSYIVAGNWRDVSDILDKDQIHSVISDVLLARNKPSAMVENDFAGHKFAFREEFAKVAELLNKSSERTFVNILDEDVSMLCQSFLLKGKRR